MYKDVLIKISKYIESVFVEDKGATHAYIFICINANNRAEFIGNMSADDAVDVLHSVADGLMKDSNLSIMKELKQ